MVSDFIRDFIYGIDFIWLTVITLVITAAAYIFPVYIFIKMAISGRKNKENGSGSTADAVLTSVLLLFDMSVIFIIFIDLASAPPELQGRDYAVFLTAPIIAVWLLVLISTPIKKFFISDEKLRKIDEKLLGMHGDRPVIEDIKRKIWHILFFFCILFFSIWLVYPVLEVFPQWADPSVYPYRFWEYNPDNPSEPFFFIKLLADPSVLPTNPVIHIFLMVFFMAAGYISTLIEAVRHSKRLYSPTDQLIVFFLRREEYNGIGAYFQMFLSMSFAAYILPPLLSLSVLGTICIADMCASQIGIRFGKHKIKFNPGKSYEGTFTGIAAAFLVSLPLIGLTYSVINAILFGIIDVITGRPLKIADNLLYPFCATLIFILLNLMAIPYTFPAYLYP